MKKILPIFLAALTSKLTSFKNLSALMVVLLFSGGVWGQSTANYAFTTNTSASLVADANSNAIDMTTGTTLLVNPGLDATASIVNTIGFDFYLNGSSFSRFSVNEDGILQLGSTVITTNLYTISAGSLTSPRLAAFNADLRTGTSGKIHYKLIGTAPNRCLVVEFNNMQLFYTTATSAGTSTWQMRLYENGVIEYVYGAMNVSDINSTNKSPSIGFYLGATAFASVNYSTNTSTTTGTYTANAAVAATGDITNLHSTADGSRRVYLYTPTSANAPTALTFSNISSGAMQLNWTDNSADELGFIIERSTDNITFTTLATLAANTVTYNAINLAANTTYYFKVSPVREAKGTALSGNQTTSAAPTYASVISIDGNTAVPGISYPTITAAVNDLGGTIANAITIQLTSTYNAANETYPIQLRYVAGSSATNTLTIVQSSGVSGTIIESSNASSTFIIDGGNYWIIDGRSGGTGSTKDLVISNSSVTGTAIQLINDASYNTLKYCTFKGVNTSATSGVVVIGSTTTTATTGNDYNTITYCDVRDGATTPTNGIYSKGLTTGTNNNNLISYNNVYNFFRDSSGIDSYGIYITTGSNDFTIDNNSLYQTLTRTLTCGCTNSSTAAGSIPIATSTASGYNFTITNNYIGGSAPLAAGTAWTVTSSNATLSYYVFQGIRMLTSLTGATSTIQGNTIKNINITTTNAASNQGGIIATGGNVNINNNTIGDPDASGSSPSIVFNNGGTGEFNGIRTGTSSATNGALSITNNTIAGIIINPVSGVGTVDFVGIRFGTTIGGTSNIASTNTIGSLTVANSIVNSTAKEITGIYFQSISPINTASNNIISNLSSTYSSSATTNRIYGIYTTNVSGLAGGTNSIIGNTIKNLTTTCPLVRSSASSMNLGNISIYGIYANSTTTNSLISSNTIFGLKNTSTTTASHILGIYATAPATTYTNIIEKNSIYNLGFSGSSTTALTTVQGILTPSTATICTIKNNNIRLGYDASGTQLNNGMYIYGIYDQTTTTGTMNIWHNTIYIGGNAVASTAYPTYCFVSAGTSATRVFQNNIFINARSNAAGTGKHHAVYFTTTSTGGLTSNKNIFSATGTGAQFGRNATTDCATITAWRNATSQDANSLDTDPVLNSPTATTPNLHLTNVSSVASGAATFIASVTDDMDGQPRSGTTDIGADEIGISGCWTGATSTDFNTTTNWEDSTVPSSGNNIVIPSPVINNPVLDTDRTIGTLNIGTNKTIDINGKILTINAAITGAGTIKGSATSSLVLGGTAGTLNFTSGSRTLKDLTLNSSATATLGTALDITAGTTSGTVTVGTTATLTTGGNLTLKSDANGTARVGNSAGAITGNATVERYIPFGKRAFRFLTPSVTTTSSIYTNWQIGGATTAGRGTHITGSTTVANGFDITASGSPSMYTYQNNVDVSTTGWLAISNTDVTTLTAGMGYRTLVRGDRNVDISVASTDNMNVATTLSATGTLKVGDVVFDGTTTPALNTTSNTLTNGYSLIGNPYASPVDWELVSRNLSVDDYYYAWDPNMGTPAERGRYVAYSASTHQATYTGTGNTNVSKYIQPGQAIFVKTIGASPSLTFEEADKASTFTNVFRTSSNSTLSVAVYNPSEVAFASPIDATIAVFGTDFDASVGLGDIEKLYSSGEHLAWSRGAKLLAMDATTPVVTNDELLLKTMQFSANKSYTFKVNATNFDTSLNGYLVDQYLSSQTQLDFSTSNFITFATTTDAASYGANRFKVVFNSSALNNEEWSSKSLRIYPNPVVDNQFSIAVSPPITDKVAITIYNMIGQSVYYESASAINNSIVVRPSAILKAGVYMVQMVNNGKTNTQKIIIK